MYQCTKPVVPSSQLSLRPFSSLSWVGICSPCGTSPSVLDPGIFTVPPPPQWYTSSPSHCHYHATPICPTPRPAPPSPLPILLFISLLCSQRHTTHPSNHPHLHSFHHLLVRPHWPWLTAEQHEALDTGRVDMILHLQRWCLLCQEWCQLHEFGLVP